MNYLDLYNHFVLLIRIAESRYAQRFTIEFSDIRILTYITIYEAKEEGTSFFHTILCYRTSDYYFWHRGSYNQTSLDKTQHDRYLNHDVNRALSLPESIIHRNADKPERQAQARSFTQKRKSPSYRTMRTIKFKEKKSQTHTTELTKE